MLTIETPVAAASKHNSGTGSDARNFLLLSGACFLLFFLALGSWGFIDPGDGYFSEAAREMIESSNYLVPHLNYQIYFSKPILIFWLIISAYKVFGINAFAARFWSAATATTVVLVLYWTVRCLAGKRAGVLAGLALATSPLVITFARMSLIDMSFSALIGTSFCATAMTLMSDSRRWWVVIYACLGLAVLDKGPAAVVVYALGAAGYLLALKPDAAAVQSMCKRLRVIPGLLLLAAVALPWYVAVGLATKWLWPQVFFLFENLGRFAGHTNHRVPYAWFYIPVVAYGFFPWMLFLPAALLPSLRFSWKRWRQSGSVNDDRLQDARLFFTAASLGIILFFSASMTKLQTYILPAWPAMAALVGMQLDDWLKRSSGQPSRYLKSCAVVFAALGGAAAIGAVIGTGLAADPQQLPALVHGKWALQLSALLLDIDVRLRAAAVIFLALAGVGLLIVWKRLHIYECERAMQALCLTAVAAGTIGGITCYQLGYKYKNADVHKVIAVIKDKPGPVALFRDFKPSLVYYLQRPVDSFFAVDQLHARTAVNDPHQTQYIIAGPKGARDLLAAYPNLRTVASSGGWYVFASDDLVALRLPTLKESFINHIDLSGGEYSWGTLPFAGGSKPPTQ